MAYFFQGHGVFTDLCDNNGVKQRRVLSPVLFSVYIDGLLQALSSSKNWLLYR